MTLVCDSIALRGRLGRIEAVKEEEEEPRRCQEINPPRASLLASSSPPNTKPLDTARCRPLPSQLQSIKASLHKSKLCVSLASPDGGIVLVASSLWSSLSLFLYRIATVV